MVQYSGIWCTCDLLSSIQTLGGDRSPSSWLLVPLVVEDVDDDEEGACLSRICSRLRAFLILLRRFLAASTPPSLTPPPLGSGP